MSQRATVGGQGRQRVPMPAAYRFEIKAPGFAPGAPAPAMTGAEPAEVDAPDAEEQVEQHEWSGDLYEDGEMPDLSGAFAHLRGQAGEEAWLERAEDGTLTGWVLDTDGSGYRYVDADGWAQDVDAAAMTRMSGNAEDGQDEDVEGDVLEDGAPAGPGGNLAPGPDDEVLDDEDVEEDPDLDPDADLGEDDLADEDLADEEDAEGDLADEDLDPEGDLGEDEDEDEDGAPKKGKQPPWLKKGQTKALTAPTGHRYSITRSR